MKYAFVAEHRPQFLVHQMCRCLSTHPSGFYAWVKNPLSRRAQEDARQTKLLKEAWKESGKVYGYRKLHDDLIEQGETSCPNRVARLTSMAGMSAQPTFLKALCAARGNIPDRSSPAHSRSWITTTIPPHLCVWRTATGPFSGSEAGSD